MACRSTGCTCGKCRQAASRCSKSAVRIERPADAADEERECPTLFADYYGPIEGEPRRAGPMPAEGRAAPAAVEEAQVIEERGPADADEGRVKPCLTTDDLCNPRSCSYDPAKCDEQRPEPTSAWSARAGSGTWAAVALVLAGVGGKVLHRALME